MTLVPFGGYPEGVRFFRLEIHSQGEMMIAQAIKSIKSILIFTSMISILFLLVGCGPSASELETVNYTPQSGNKWELSTPEEQGLDPELVAELYYNASQMENIYSLLVFKNNYLVAEDYFNSGTPEQQVNIHSITKSINIRQVFLMITNQLITSINTL